MEKQTMIVYGDGVTDDSDALQAHIDGKASLIYPDGAPFSWPGKCGARHAIGKALLLPNTAAHTAPQPRPLTGAWIGRK